MTLQFCSCCGMVYPDRKYYRTDITKRAFCAACVTTFALKQGFKKTYMGHYKTGYPKNTLAKKQSRSRIKQVV